ncbi:MAG: DUF6527 family protein [Candidatus Pacearchaeota archaeon]|jgi:hypothetical protein
MKIKFIKSLADVTFGDTFPAAEKKWIGKASRITLGNGKTGLMIVLPCGHIGTVDSRWNITNIDTPTPSATPSILCKENGGCWHGYLTNGELVSV